MFLSLDLSRFVLETQVPYFFSALLLLRGP